LRFQRALERIDECDPPRWVDLAFQCGYFDQSHMIREFRELAGCTPEEYLGLQLACGGVSAGPAPDAENSAPR
jgi:AraC-like DNA-binding protein